MAIDLTELRLPTRLIWPTCLTTLALLTLTAGYLTLAVATRGGIGNGDIRLAAIIGLILAWRSWPALASGTIIAFGLAGTAGLIMTLLKRATWHSTIPYGPAMIAGAFTVLLVAP